MGGSIRSLRTRLFGRSPAPANPLVSTDHRQPLLAADRAWATAAAMGEIDRVVTFWAEDAVNYLPGEVPARGRDAIISMVRRYRSDPAFSLSWHAQTVEVAASGELGFTSGRFTMTRGGGRETVIRTGHYLCVWHKLPGGDWKCAVETSVFDGNGQ